MSKPKSMIATMRAWSPALVPVATLLALCMAYLLLASAISSPGIPESADLGRRVDIELAKIAWAACQLVVFSALGWHIAFHAVQLRDESREMPRALAAAAWAVPPLIGVVAALYFFHSQGSTELVATLLQITQQLIPGVNAALNLSNTMAAVAVALLAAWAFALLRPRAAPGKDASHALARRFLVSLYSSAALLVIALVEIWVLNLVPAAVEPGHAAIYRDAASGIVLAAGVCFSAVLVLVYLPLLAMLRARRLIDEQAVSGTVITAAKTFAAILAPAVSGLLGAAHLILP